MNIGSDVTIGGDVISMEKNIAIADDGTGTITGTPVDFGGFGLIGWISEPNKNDWQKVIFTGQKFTSSLDASIKNVTVKYASSNSASRQLKISSNIIPKTVHAVMRAQLFAAQDSGNKADSTKIGEIQIDIPRFEFDGNETISMTSNGNAKASLNGTALSVDSDTIEDEAYFGTFKEVLDSANWYDYVSDLSVVDDEIELSSTETTATVEVLAVGTSSLPFRPNYADLTFVSGTPGTCNIDATGKITKVAAGTSLITVKITAKPSVQAVANVTVTA